MAAVAVAAVLAVDIEQVAVSDALRNAGFWREADRLGACGEDRPLYCGACGHVRVGRYRCDLALCVSCARRRSARLVASWTKIASRVPAAPGYRWALLTLTLRRTAAPLRDQVARILRHWRAFRGRLRRRCDPEGRRMGGFMSVEVAGAVHLHVLGYLPFVPQAWLSSAWLAVTGDSPIVDVRAVRGATADALREVVKYIGKAIGTGDTDRAVETWAAMKGRQVRRPWGVAWAIDRAVPKLEICGMSCEKCGGEAWLTADGLAWLERRAVTVLPSRYG